MKKLLFLFLISLMILPSAVMAGNTVAPPPGMNALDNLTANDIVMIIINVRNWFAGIVLILAVVVVLFGAFTI
jgi:hypothetical protein